MLKSKMIYDPNQQSRWAQQGNKLGHTVGLVFYSTKYMKCNPEGMFASQFDTMSYRNGDGLDEQELEERFQYWYWHKHHCKPGARHRTYKGYMYWTGPKRRYEFRYAGRTHPRDKWYKPFTVSKHGRYTRLFDNGPQSPLSKLTPLEGKDIKILDRHRREFSEALASSRQQMQEYVRVRGYEL